MDGEVPERSGENGAIRATDSKEKWSQGCEKGSQIILDGLVLPKFSGDENFQLSLQVLVVQEPPDVKSLNLEAWSRVSWTLASLCIACDNLDKFNKHVGAGS